MTEARQSQHFRAFANHIATAIAGESTAEVTVAVGTLFATEQAVDPDCAVAFLQPRSPYINALNVRPDGIEPYTDSAGFTWYAVMVDGADVRRITGSTLPTQPVLIAGPQDHWSLTQWS